MCGALFRFSSIQFLTFYSYFKKVLDNKDLINIHQLLCSILVLNNMYFLFYIFSIVFA